MDLAVEQQQDILNPKMRPLEKAVPRPKMSNAEESKEEDETGALRRMRTCTMLNDFTD